MNILHRPKIVLLGMMSRMPVAAWSGRPRTTLSVCRGSATTCITSKPMVAPVLLHERAAGRWWADAAAFIQRTCQPSALPTSGLTTLAITTTASRNERGATPRTLTASRPDHQSARRYRSLPSTTRPDPNLLETDPVELQSSSTKTTAAIDFLEPHFRFLHLRRKLRNPDCLLPVSDRFHSSRRVSLWSATSGSIPIQHRVRPSPHRQLGTGAPHGSFQAKLTIGAKHYEFLKFIDLPTRVNHGTHFELALAKYDDPVEQNAPRPRVGVRR